MSIIVISQSVLNSYNGESIEQRPGYYFINIINKNIMNCLPKRYNVLTLETEDIEPNNIQEAMEYEKLTGKKSFSKTEAVKIINFLKDINLSELKTMVISCQNGITISGAIAVFVAEHLSYRKELLEYHNPHIRPNLWVLSTLNQTITEMVREKNLQ